jgi:hypothetical protein
MAESDSTTEAPTLIERITRYLALCDNPEFIECPTCKGKGYHHGFGEGGVDPDWCSGCGGPGALPHPDWDISPDDLLRLAVERLRGLEHERAMIEADTRRGITDCSTPLFQRVRNIVEELTATEAKR